MLDDTAVKDLKLSGKGQGIIKIGDTHAPIAFIPSDEELKIIKGYYTGNIINPSAPSDDTTAPVVDGRIKEEYLTLAKENYIIFNEWIEGEDQAYNLQKIGYKPQNPQNIINRGNVLCWVHEGTIKEDGNIKNQSQDHYFTVIQLAGLLIDMGFEDVKVNHSDDVDVSAKLHGKTYGFEYEHPDSHNKGEIIDKKRRSVPMYKHLLFIGSRANETLLKEAAGLEFVRRRGSQLKTWLNQHVAGAYFNTGVESTEEKTEPLPSETRISEPMIEQCEAMGAL